MDLGIPQNSRRLALLLDRIPSVVGRQEARRAAEEAPSWSSFRDRMNDMAFGFEDEPPVRDDAMRGELQATLGEDQDQDPDQEPPAAAGDEEEVDWGAVGRETTIMLALNPSGKAQAAD